MEINKTRLTLLAAVTLPVAAWLIYRNLTPGQKNRFKKSFFKGATTLATTLFTGVVDQFKRHTEPAETIDYGISPEMDADRTNEQSPVLAGHSPAK